MRIPHYFWNTNNYMLDFEICQRYRQDILKAGQQFRFTTLCAVKEWQLQKLQGKF